MILYMCTQESTEQKNFLKGEIQMKKTTTTKAKAIEKMNAYREYTRECDCYVTPTKGINSGSDGRMYELAVKMCLNNYRFSGIVASAKSIDTTKKIGGKVCKFEIKSGCGTLCNLDREGNIINSPLLKSDYVIYSPRYYNDVPVAKQAYVFSISDFLFVLGECGLIRYKYSGNQYFINKDGKKERKANAYYDKMTIQTFLNSKCKTELLYDMLEQYGQRLDNFCTENNIKFNSEV